MNSSASRWRKASSASPKSETPRIRWVLGPATARILQLAQLVRPGTRSTLLDYSTKSSKRRFPCRNLPAEPLGRAEPEGMFNGWWNRVHPMRRHACVLALLAAASLAAASPARSASPKVAALQLALFHRGYYRGPF